MERRAETRRAIAERLLRDPEFGELLKSNPSVAEAEIRPEELATFKVGIKKSTCGNECGCDADKGVGCDPNPPKHGVNDEGGDCVGKIG